MGQLLQQKVAPMFAEDIRLVIWDLDETFWDGTLTEGGISYVQDNHDLVIALAQRGIMSAICSKNKSDQVEAVLREKGIWEYFIFPSVDWSPKGPRIRVMLEQIGLRAASVLFLDDNPMNLAQAAHLNPGLNVGQPELIGQLRDAPQVQGRPNARLTRLRQYKVMEAKAQAAEAEGGDTIDFLRNSNVRVVIEYEVERHLDRAIELINRTNQLNFTKQRLPEGREDARAALLALLARNTTDAALIRVVDDYGDYGFAGFYLTERLHNVRRITHFCFSCRVLNMYVEHWAYAHLGRPPMKVVGEVLSDPVGDPVAVDWITPQVRSEAAELAQAPQLRFDRIVARGGCDLASLMHYFAMHAKDIVEEFNLPKAGQMFRRDHTAFVMPAIGEPLSPAQVAAAARLGYERADFETALGDDVAGSPLYFLSFWADVDVPVYRHRDTGLRVPYWLVGAQNHDLIARDDLRHAVAETDVQRARLQLLCQEYEHEGLLHSEEMVRRYRMILDALPAGAPVVVVLANEKGPLHFQNPNRPLHPHHQRLNEALRQVVEGRDNVLLLDPMDHIKGAADMLDLNHFKRPVYHRMYRDVLARLSAREAGA